MNRSRVVAIAPSFFLIGNSVSAQGGWATRSGSSTPACDASRGSTWVGCIAPRRSSAGDEARNSSICRWRYPRTARSCRAWGMGRPPRCTRRDAGRCFSRRPAVRRYETPSSTWSILPVRSP